MTKTLKFATCICLFFGTLSNSIAGDLKWVHCSTDNLPKSIDHICYGRARYASDGKTISGQRTDGGGESSRWYAKWIQTALQASIWQSDAKIYNAIVKAYKKQKYSGVDFQDFNTRVAFGSLAPNNSSQFITSELNNQFFGGKLGDVMADMMTYPINPNIARWTARSIGYRYYILDRALLDYFAEHKNDATTRINVNELRQSMRNKFNNGISEPESSMYNYALCIAKIYNANTSINAHSNMTNIWEPLARKYFSTAMFNINQYYGSSVVATYNNCKHP